jgi:hypothetical protein
MSTIMSDATAILSRPDVVNVDGRPENVLTLPEGDRQDLAEGTLSFRFEADTLEGVQGLYSREPLSAGDDNHLSIYLFGSFLFARIEAGGIARLLGGSIEAGRPTHVALSFDGNEARLFIDGDTVGETETTYTETGPAQAQFGAIG